MKCQQCGSEQANDAKYCNNCGSVFQDSLSNKNQISENDDDKLSRGMRILCFLIFPLGFIIWLNEKDTKPNMAKSAVILSSIALGIGLIARTAAMSSYDSNGRHDDGSQYANEAHGEVHDGHTVAHTELSHAELFGDYSSQFNMICYAEFDNSYVYTSHDNACWVEVYGDSSRIEKFYVNTEPQRGVDSADLIEYQNHFIEAVAPRMVRESWIETMIDRWHRTHSVQTDHVGPVEFRFFMESLAGGEYGINTEVYFD
jgi:hypothetical protein